MIANARMYAVSPEAAADWRSLLSALIAQAGVAAEVIDHGEPQPIDDLWRRPDKAAVFMCGLPFSRAQPQPVLVAAPVPAPPEFAGRACYWSDFVVRADSAFLRVRDTFGGRIAFTSPDSQSGCVAALSYFLPAAGATIAPLAQAGERLAPLFREVIAPTITPLGALTAVVNGAADIAPIDSYALRLLQAYRPDLTSQIRVVGRTAATPIPPLVASTEDVAALSSAFLQAQANPAAKRLMDKLRLQRFIRPGASSYAGLSRRFADATLYWSSRPLATLSHPAFAGTAMQPAPACSIDERSVT